MKTLTDSKQVLMDRAGELLDLARETDFVIPDDTGYFSIEDEVVRQVRALVRQSADLMRDVMEHYDAESPVHVPNEVAAGGDEDFLREIGAQISAKLAVEEVSGLAFVSRGQLLDTLSALDHAVTGREIWKVASHVDAGLRRAGRALVAVESAIRECEGLPAVYRPWQNLDDSLEVRRVYGEFRRAVLGGDDESEELRGEELGERLHDAAGQIAELRRLDIYPYLRIDDRLEIRRLQKRIHAWIEEGGDAEAGGRLWSDLVAFARLLSAINHRQEIREHDRLAVNGLYQRFFEHGGMPERLTPDQLSWLEPLQGLDDELDVILLDPGRHRGADLKAPLARLRRELGRPFERPPHADFLSSAHG